MSKMYIIKIELTYVYIIYIDNLHLSNKHSYINILLYIHWSFPSYINKDEKAVYFIKYYLFPHKLYTARTAYTKIKRKIIVKIEKL